MKLPLLVAASLALLAACSPSSAPVAAAGPPARIPAPPLPPPVVVDPPQGFVVRITDPARIFAAADLSKEGEAALKAAGWKGDVEKVKTHMNEKGGWPPALANEETRHFQVDTLKDYHVEQLASYRYYKQDVVLLRVPASGNKHMAADWQLPEDFYIVASAKAIAPAK
jgi:hypothetical protein